MTQRQIKWYKELGYALSNYGVPLSHPVQDITDHDITLFLSKLWALGDLIKNGLIRRVGINLSYCCLDGLENVRKEYVVERILDKCMRYFTKGPSEIFKAFYWDGTTEGTDFWRDARNAMTEKWNEITIEQISHNDCIEPLLKRVFGDLHLIVDYYAALAEKDA